MTLRDIQEDASQQDDVSMPDDVTDVDGTDVDGTDEDGTDEDGTEAGEDDEDGVLGALWTPQGHGIAAVMEGVLEETHAVAAALEGIRGALEGIRGALTTSDGKGVADVLKETNKVLYSAVPRKA